MKDAKRTGHGGDWVTYTEKYGKDPLDFSSNINPFGMPKGAEKAAAGSIAGSVRYPDPFARELRKKLGEKLGISPDHIFCGNGAADLIFRLVLAVKPRKALVTAPSFSEYESALSAAGCKVDRYMLHEEAGFKIKEDFLSAISDETDIVFLCEPNNPTGVTTERKLLWRILEECEKKDAVLVIDECFNLFLDDPKEHTMMDRMGKTDNLLILRAFTKSFGMPGLRLGYCVSSSGRILDEMEKAGQPWPVSFPAQAAGIAALGEPEHVKKARMMISEERRKMIGALREMGMKVIAGEANYLLFHCTQDLSGPLMEKGILIRDCANYSGLSKGWYRTAIKLPGENEKLIRALWEVMK